MFSSPQIDLTGNFICWMEWSHPNMPWDESYIYIGQLSSNGSEILSTLCIAGIGIIVIIIIFIQFHLKLSHNVLISYRWFT